ncbi:MAG: GNAT family N-acetyltransferase [Patescibacteria group bacterium]
MDTSSIVIETDRLILKPISLDYKEEMFAEFTPEITRHMFPSSPEKIEESIEYINGAMGQNKAGTDYIVNIILKDTGEYLGNGGIEEINTKTPELGIWIKKSAHGYGYGREAVAALKKWGEENLKYDYIKYPVVDVNIASRKIPESLGGVIEREYDEVNASGVNLHMVEYRIYPDKK